MRSTADNPHTFGEAVEYLKNSPADYIDYEVVVGSNQGALMTRDTWLKCVQYGSFIDYDGYGSQVTADGAIVGKNIIPSKVDVLLTETAYILWYNK